MTRDNKNKIMFGRGTKSLEEFKSVTGYQNMVYFNTDEYEIYVGDNKYGFSKADQALLGDGGIHGISFDAATSKLIIELNSQNADKTHKTVSVNLPAATTTAAGLMTSTHVNALAAAGLEIETLTGNGEGSVKKAQADAEAYAKGLVDSVLSEDVDAAGAAIVKISQGADGKIVAEAGNVEAAHVSVADANEKYVGTNVEEVLAEIANKISELNKGSEDADDLIEESQKAIAAIEEKLGDGFSKDSTVAGKIEEVANSVKSLKTTEVAANTKGVADNKAAIEKEVEDRQQAVLDAIAEIKGTLGDGEAATLEGIHDRIDAVAKSVSFSIEKVTEGLGTNVKEAYQLVDSKGDKQGEVINIYKDSALKSVELTDKNAEGEAGQFLKFTYLTADGTEDIVYVDVNALLVESEFKNGLTVSAAGEVSVKIATASESFLTVDGDGVKLSGVQDAINNAKDAAKSELVNNASEGYQTLKDLEDKIKSAASTAAEHTTVKTGEGHDNELVKVENTKTEGGLEYTITATNIAKASDLTALTNKVNNEVVPAIATAEQNAKNHADAEVKKLREGEVAANASAISKETEDRIQGDTDTLNAAKTYTDEALYWYEG